MNLRDHDGREDMKVWLSADEIDQLLALLDGQSNRRFAIALAVRCGLRSEEVTEVSPEDIVDSDAGPIVTVKDGKGGKYRETPIPPDLKREIDAAAEYRPHPRDWPVVTTSSDGRGASTRTLRRWIEAAREQLAEEDDSRWQHLTMHDLRRTWATHLKSEDVDAMLVCDWGGWSDLETFLDAYRGDFTPEAQRREREKVGWL